ncbi:MAG: VWA domain-containing protein [Rubrivivax sp.]
MEETVGALWHRAVTRWADQGHAAAAVEFDAVRRPIELLFRAAGGSPALRLAEAGLSRAGGTRHWLQKLAHVDGRAPLPRLDAETLALPPRVAVFDDAALNRALYLWLAALAAVHVDRGDWIADNLAATRRALQVCPGLATRQRALVQAQLALRPADDRGAAEAAVRAALRDGLPPPHAVQPHEVAPVWLWLLPAAASAQPARRVADDTERPPARRLQQDRRRLHAQACGGERSRPPLVLPFRAESLLSFAEMVRVDRAEDDEDDGHAARAAGDLDHLSSAPDGRAPASRVRFDLDLPSAAVDDLPLGEGEQVPEWDWRARRLLPGHCAVQTRVARPGPAFVPPPALRATARRVRRRLETLRAAPRRLHAQRDGDRLDLDAWVRTRSEAPDEQPAVWLRDERGERELATLLLADLSLSTEAHVDDQQRVIDVVRDALYVFGEALSASGDAFQMLGFSSVRRQHVRLQHLKGFDEAWNDTVRARLAALKPGYYTRMGAALRAATRRLAERPERQRLLLLLTDGKPNDLDVYEGRYGLEDTREAVREARAAGVLPFAVTIDEQAADYLPQLFGQDGFALVRRPRELVGRLAQVYARLTRHARSA